MELNLTLPAFKPLATALVVDDNDDIVYLLRLLLLREGFVVHTATDGRQVADFIENSEPTDLVLMDLLLPYIGGFELITRIRENRKWAEVPIIVLSGKVTERDVVRALETGADDYVTKPYNPQELCARIRRHMRNRGRQ